MGRFRDSGSDDSNDAAIDVSPMMDMVFILLIFFIVTTTFVEETGVEVDKPTAAAAIALPKESVLIAVTKKGEVVYGGREIGVNGVQPLVKRMLAKEDIPVIVQADENSQSGLLVKVVGEAKQGGAKHVNLSTAKPKG